MTFKFQLLQLLLENVLYFDSRRGIDVYSIQESTSTADVVLMSTPYKKAPSYGAGVFPLKRKRVRDKSGLVFRMPHQRGREKEIKVALNFDSVII